MRRWIFFMLFGSVLFACKQEIDLYEGESSIYFDDNYAGYYEVTWSTTDSDIKKMDIQLKVNLFGAVKDYPRKFNIQVISEETDSLHACPGVDYTPFPLEYEMPAMVNHTYINIELLRTDTLLKQGRMFTVQLVPNENFGFEYMKYYWNPEDSTNVALNDHCTVYMDEKFPEPWWWYRIGVPIFGKWSVTKGLLICDVGGIERAKLQGDLNGIDGALTEAFLKFVGRKVHLWLQEHPTLDEDGEPMEMGEDSIY